MSRQSNNTRFNNASKVACAPQPYCAHCFNLKKPESEYRSHFLRASTDPKSPVVCPELLATICRYCLKTGHTVSSCSVLAAKKRDEERDVKQKEKETRMNEQRIEQTKQSQVKKQQNKGAFAALLEDSSDDEKEMTLKVSTTKATKNKPMPISSKIDTFEEKFPALPTKTVSSLAAPKLMNYAGMAAKSKSEYEDEQYLKTTMTKRVEMPLLKRGERIVEQNLAKGPATDFWAGWDSDEDEADYALKRPGPVSSVAQLPPTHAKPIVALKASEIDWAMELSDSSDDEDEDEDEDW